MTSRPVPLATRLAIDRVDHHHQAEEHEDRGRHGIADRLEGPRRLRLARAQHEDGGHGNARQTA